MQSQTANTLKSELNGAAKQSQKAMKSASSDISSQIDTLVERAEDVVKTYQPQVEAAAKSTVDFVRRHPVACAVGALAVGYVLVAFSRRNRE